MAPLTLYFFLAIVQVTGGQGMTFGTLEECQTVRLQASNDPSVIFLSDCKELTLIPITVPKDKATRR